MTDQETSEPDDQMQPYTLLAPGEFQKYRALPPYAQFIIAEALRRKWEGRRPKKLLTIEYLWMRHIQYIERMGRMVDAQIRQNRAAGNDGEVRDDQPPRADISP